MHIKMEELARLLGCTRLNVSSILNKWKEEGLIEMRRKAFVVHDIAKLLEKTLNS
jgi:CRP-like cAMP-binding protein